MINQTRQANTRTMQRDVPSGVASLLGRRAEARQLFGGLDSSLFLLFIGRVLSDLSVLLVLLAEFRRKKRSLTVKLSSEKKSGIELLSHSQICSTIVAGPLIDRVRDGNVSDKPAMDTGKKGLKMSGLCRLSCRNDKQIVNWEIAILY